MAQSKENPPSRWRTVRIFISSTFSDMHAERDHLVRFVFPELKEKCRKLHVHLIDVDLRWGVSEADAQEGKALDICLDEIDSCRPYFLGLLGQRYGHIPSGHHHSITAQEIFHGVLHNELPKQVVYLRSIIEGRFEGKRLSDEQVNTLVKCYQFDGQKYTLKEDISQGDIDIIKSVFAQYSAYQRDRSFFFFRNESLTRQLAGDNTNAFFEDSPENQDKLKALKQEIIKEGLPHFEYDSIEKFGELVRDTLWSHIEKEIGETSEVEKDLLKEEDELHELFMADRTRRFVGRRDLLDKMHAFCRGDSRIAQGGGSQSNIIVITGEPGCGKSALMARFTEEFMQKHPAVIVIPHFIGASPSSTSLRLMLKRLCMRIYKQCDLERQKIERLNQIIGNDENAHKEREAVEKEYNIPEDYKELVQTFPQFLKKASEYKIIILIDAVNQLEKTDNAHSMYWLPHEISENVCLIISTLAGDAHDTLMRRRVKPVEEIVHGLIPSEIKDLVREYLDEVRKGKFPNEDIERAFFEKIKSGNPLYILVALEELRIFPRFEEVGSRIEELPENVPALFEQVLQRIEGDFTQEVVKDMMSYIACGRYGMTAEELQTLLRNHAPRLADSGPCLPAGRQAGMTESEFSKLPDILWARLYRAFSAYLFERSGVIDFFHGQLKEAVGKRYLMGETDRDKVHKIITDYFDTRWQEPYVRALDELPHQRTKAKDWEGLERILTDLIFIEKKCAVGMTYDLIADYNSALDNLPEAQDEKQKELEHEKRVKKYVDDLIAYAKGEIKQLDIIPSVEPWSEEKIRQETEKIKHNPTRLDRIQAFSQFVNSESHGLVKFGSMPGFCLQQAYNSANSGPVAKAAEAIVRTKTGSVFLFWSLLHRPDYNPFPLLIRTLEGNNTEIISSLSITPDGKRAVSIHYHTTLCVWNLKTGECLMTLEGHADAVESVSITPDGKRAVSGSHDKTLRVWDIESGQCLMTLEGHTEHISSVSITPDGELSISGGVFNDTCVWGLERGECLRTFGAVANGANCVSITADGEMAILGRADATLRMLNLESGECIRTLEGHTDYVSSVRITPDGKRAVSIGGGLGVWDIESGNCLKKYDNWCFNCSITPDGKRAISDISWDDPFQMWDLESGECLGTLAVSQYLANGMTITPDGKMAVPASKDGTVDVLDMGICKYLRILEGYTDSDSIDKVSITPDGKIAVIGSGVMMCFWDLESGECIRTLEGHTDYVSSVRITPDGKTVVSGSHDKTLREWDLKTGECLRTLEGHTDDVTSVRITPDGKTVVSGSHDETLRVWDLDSTHCSAIIHVDREGPSASEISADGYLAYGVNGEVFFLKLYNLPMEPPIVTAQRIWLFGEKKKGYWHKRVTFLCKRCGWRHEVADKILDVIKGINKNAGLTPDQSPCLELPYEAWDEPRLLSECPHCKKPLKFNPFIVDNRDRY